MFIIVKIAFCDDELSVLNDLRILLDQYRVERNHDLAYTAFQSPLNLLAEIERGTRYDILFLDVMMPGETGIDAAAEIRKRYDTPIIFLTAYSSESDKVMGFSVGADDYIVKPFSNMELLMRVRAILRRHAASVPAEKKNQISFQDVILDLDSQTLLRNGERIPLTYTEFKILELLASNKKKIYSLENIYSSIWDDNAVGDSAIMVHIKNIRKKLGDNSRNPTYIKTAWGRGYYID